jgi:hypothetical protein
VYTPSKFELFIVKGIKGSSKTFLNFFNTGFNKIGGYITKELFAAR